MGVRAVTLGWMICALMAGPVLADAQMLPQLRPVPTAALRPMLRPDSQTPVVAKAAAPGTHAGLARQEARADALTIVPMLPEPLAPILAPLLASAAPVAGLPRQDMLADALAVVASPPAPVVLVGLWAGSGPEFRPQGDFGGDEAAVGLLTDAVFRPHLRPDLQAIPAAVIAPPVVLASAILRPQLRPGDLRGDSVTDVTPTFAVALAVPAAPSLSALAVNVALIPQARSADIVARAEAARVERVRGSVCGNPQIQGENLGHVAGAGACGIDDGVLVRSVNGVRLSTAATIDCTTANALQDWVSDAAQPIIGNSGGGLASIEIMGSYACRGRNNQAGARLSEHGFGRALDIGGFTLQDGSSFSVLNGWGSGSAGDMLRQMHRAACGIFGTVLGPNANSFHRNHFHFDTARYRSGSYCQ